VSLHSHIGAITGFLKFTTSAPYLIWASICTLFTKNYLPESMKVERNYPSTCRGPRIRVVVVCPSRKYPFNYPSAVIATVDAKLKVSNVV
jgi:hypothetical protein